MERAAASEWQQVLARTDATTNFGILVDQMASSSRSTRIPSILRRSLPGLRPSPDVRRKRDGRTTYAGTNGIFASFPMPNTQRGPGSRSTCSKHSGQLLRSSVPGK